MKQPQSELENQPHACCGPSMRAWAKALRRALPALGLLFTACGAQSSADPDVGTETQWLDQCDSDAECGALDCICGRCTLACQEREECRQGELECVPLPDACARATRSACARSEANFELPVADASETSDADSNSSQSTTARESDAGKVTQSNLLGLPQGSCDAEGWCWQSPTPVGDLFFAITDDAKYAAGEYGVVVELPDRYLKTAAEDVQYIENTADGLWGITGSGLVSYATEAGWVLRHAGTYEGMTVSSDGQLWLLGSGGVEHLVDGQWVSDALPASSDPTSPWYTLDIAALDAETIWVLASDFADPKRVDVERHTTVFQLRRGEWSELPGVSVTNWSDWRFLKVGSKVYVHEASASSSHDIYDVAEAWSVVATKPPAVDSALFVAPDGSWLGSGSSGTYAFDAKGSRKLSNTRCRVAVPEGDSAVRCVASGGGLPLLQLDVEAPADDPRLPLSSESFGQIPVEVWARGTLAWASGPSDVWRDWFEHFDGTAWTSFADDVPGDLNGSLSAISGSAPDNVWFAGVDTLLRFDGEEFHVVPTADDESTVFYPSLLTFAPDDTWVLREAGVASQILHFDGEQWLETLSADTTASFFLSGAALFGKGSTDVWAALGDSAYHFENGAWSKVCEKPGTSFNGVAFEAGELWLSASGIAYQLAANGEVIQRGKPTGGAQGFALTTDYVWQFGYNVRTLER